MTKNVQERLVDIFKTVADLCDGGGAPDELVDVYRKHMRDREFGEFYGALVEQRSEEVFGPRG